MSDHPLPPKLIQANIAFFKGDRAETERLLRAYRAETPDETPHQAMILWLEAHIQTDHAAHLKLLTDLVNTVPNEDSYVQMARDVLEQEQHYQEQLKPASRRHPRRNILLFMAVVVSIGIGGFFLRDALSGESTNDVDTSENPPEVTEAPLPTPSPFPDKSQELPPRDYMARYDAGILQIAAVEVGAERVVNRTTRNPVIPVAGAHFYALRLIFECRSGVCNAPPEADLILTLSSTDEISARPDVVIAGGDIFEPIALGRTTSGWVVFEIPLVSEVEALLITPGTEDSPPEMIALTDLEKEE